MKKEGESYAIQCSNRCGREWDKNEAWV